MVKEYTVTDLFFTRWEDLSARTQSEVYALCNALPELRAKEGAEYGMAIIHILRRLRKNPALVNKINVEQAVDIFNDMSFLQQPWYYFPVLENKALAMVRPSEKMARSSFDQFIYADHEFTSFIAKQEEKHLRRLVVTLYPLLGDKYFDKECVDERAAAIDGKLKPWQLNLVFFTFAHVRAHIVERCKHLLPTAPKAKDDIEQPPVITGRMWYQIRQQAARTHVFGSMKKTGRANMYDVLDYLNTLCEEKANAKS